MQSADSLISGNFSLTLKKEIIENRKTLLLGVGGIWGICILIGAFLGYNVLGGDFTEMIMLSIMFAAVGCVVASMTFANMKTKESRIASILLPDTAFDKFLVRWIAVVPMLFLIMIAGFYLTEISRILVFKLSNDGETIANCGVYCRMLNPWFMMGFGESEISNGIRTSFIASYFFSQSFYILGAILWPKLSFIKTFVALWVLQTIFSIVLIALRNIDIDANIDVRQFLNLIAAAEIMGALIIYLLSYLRFRHSQVVYKLF